MKFTYNNYQKLLNTLLRDYEFISFSRAKYNPDTNKKNILLRHDIDQSLEKAKIMSDIEASVGITATYFLFLKSPFYNIFSYEEEKYIQNIIENNHHIGLHFDYSNYEIKTVSQLSFQIKKEADFIQNYFGIKVDAVSFHRPFDIDFFSKLELSIYPHAYESIFLEKYKYFSDSRGQWRFGDPLESTEYKQGKNLHILIHPIWWNENEILPEQSIGNFRESYTFKLEKFLKSELKGFWEGLKNEK
jgi:hypothetical protein